MNSLVKLKKGKDVVEVFPVDAVDYIALGYTHVTEEETVSPKSIEIGVGLSRKKKEAE